jgi:F0F1-type ATP synthase epsilon subunit
MKHPLTLVIQRPLSHEEVSISWILLSTVDGSFLIGPGHVPMVLALKPESTVSYKTGKGESEVDIGVHGGLAHVRGDKVEIFMG